MQITRKVSRKNYFPDADIDESTILIGDSEAKNILVQRKNIALYHMHFGWLVVLIFTYKPNTPFSHQQGKLQRKLQGN